MTYSVYVTTVTNNVHCVKNNMDYKEAERVFNLCVDSICNKHPLIIGDTMDDSQICVNGSYIVESVLENEETTQVQIRKAMDAMEKEGL